MIARLLVIALALAPLAAEAGGLRRKAAPPVALEARFDRYGSYLPDDAGTVLHWTADDWNLIRYPEALDNAAWSVSGAVVTPNAALAPNGTMTAERISLAGISGAGQLSAVYFPFTSTAQQYAGSVWLRSDTPGTVYVETWGGSAKNSVPCVLATTWQRCSAAVTSTGGASYLVIGEDSQAGSGQPATQPAITVEVWGAQLVVGPVPLPYKSQADTFVMNGTVPRVLTSPLYPNGFGAGRRFVGPYGDANYFTAAGLSGAGSVTICAAYTPGTASGLIAGDGSFGSGGVALFALGSGAPSFYTYGAGAAVTTTVANAPQAGTLNVMCGGRVGTTSYAKLNVGTTATNTSANAVAPSGVFRVGDYPGAGNTFDGTIREVVAYPAAWSEALVAQLQADALASGAAGGTKLFPSSLGGVSASLHVNGNDYTGGATWGPLTKVGTVAYSDSWVPPIDGWRQRTGYGSFTAANYLSLGSGNDVLDFAGDFSVCAAFSPPAIGAAAAIVSSRNAASTQGWQMHVDVGGGLNFTPSGGTPAITANTVVVGGVNVGCVGRSGGSGAAKLNLGTYTTVAGTFPVAATADAARIGVSAGATAPFGGTIYEVWASTTPPSDALFTAIQRAFFSMAGTKGEPVTVTRTTARTCTSGVVATVPPNAACVEPEGLRVDPSRTNRILRSDDLTHASWTKRGTGTATTDGTLCPDGTTLASKITVGAVTTNDVYQAASGFAASGAVRPSLWVKRVSATGVLSLTNPQSGSNGSWAIDLGAIGSGWTPVAGVQPGVTQSAAWVATAGGAAGMMFSRGGAADVTAYVCHLQQEDGPVATPYVPTTSAAVTHNADVVSVPAPAVFTRAWCMGGRFAPATPWNTARTASYMPLAAGAATAANTARITTSTNGDTLRGDTFDATATLKRLAIGHGWTGSDTRPLTFCNSAPGVPSLWSAGANIGGAVSGTGTGVLAASPSTLYLGSDGIGGGIFGGAVRSVKVCRTDRASRCQP